MKNPIIQLLILVFIASCTQVEKSKNTTDKLVYDSKSFSENLTSIAQTSSGFATKIAESKIIFIDNIINDTYKYKDYRIDLNISAANIGVYATDAQYLRAYGFNKKAYLSSQSAKKLLQILKNFKSDTSLLNSQPGYRTSDSAFFILNNALKDSVNSLTEFERKQYLLSLMIGSFIEKNYFILSGLNTNVNYKEPAIQNILHLLNDHNHQLSKIFSLRNKYFLNEYKSYLKNDLIRYNNYFAENSNTLIQGHNHHAAQLVVQNLLAQISEMRNYIIYAEILIPEKTE